MSTSSCVPCSCNVCNGSLVSERTARRHMGKAAKVVREREHGQDTPETPLHSHTGLSPIMLCIKILDLYNRYSGVTQQCITDILQIIILVLGTLMTANQQIPCTFVELEKCVHGYLAPVVKMAACPDECDLFVGVTHKCGKPRCQDNPASKIYQYIPLIPRLKQLYGNPLIAEKLQAHVNAASSATSNIKVGDIHHSPAWRSLYGPGGQFEGDFRAIALEFSSDGFAPFHHTTTKQYSVENQSSIILNFPPDMRRQPGFALLHGLVPGPSAPKEDAHNIYVRPLVDELEVLAKGVTVFDAFRKEEFTLRCAVVLHVHDFPGQAKQFHGQCSGGKHACPKCRTTGVHSQFLNKTIYKSGRKFLAMDDPLRMELDFTSGTVELGQPSMRNYSKETLVTAMNGVLQEKAKLAPARSLEKRMAKKGSAVAMDMGSRKRCSEFDRLGDDEAAKIAVEGMHTIQGIAKNLHALINGFKDNEGVRNHEENLGRFPGSYVTEQGTIPPAPFTLSRQEKKDADERLLQILIPEGKGSIPQQMFAKFTGMKSHSWHIILQRGIYVYALRGMLGAIQRAALIKFLIVITMMCSKTINMALLPRMERVYQHSLSIMDRDFPDTLKTILWHMLRHFPEFIRKYGPLHSYWMFFFERLIHHHVARLHNPKHPEASMINGHRIDALCTLVKYTNNAGLKPDIDAPTGEQSTIPADKRSHLKSAYFELFPRMGMVYRDLCKEVGTSDSLPKRPLTSEEQMLWDGPSLDIRKWYTYRKEGVTWKSWEKHGKKGSVVWKRDLVTGVVCFGYVRFFFCNTFFDIEHIFCFVEWFEQPIEDHECKLFVCRPGTSHPYLNQLVALDDLSEPLVVAYESDDKLYILDFMDEIRCKELVQWLEETSMSN